MNQNQEIKSWVIEGDFDSVNKTIESEIPNSEEIFVNNWNFRILSIGNFISLDPFSLNQTFNFFSVGTNDKMESRPIEATIRCQ